MLALSLDGLDATERAAAAYPAALAARLAAKAEPLAACAGREGPRRETLWAGPQGAFGRARASIGAEIDAEGDGPRPASARSATSNMPRSRNMAADRPRTKSCRRRRKRSLSSPAARCASPRVVNIRDRRSPNGPTSLEPGRNERRDRRRTGRRGRRRLGGRMSREAAFSALFADFSAAYPWGLASRRMKLWSEVPAGLPPGLLPARIRARDLSMDIARDADAGRWKPSSSSISTPAIPPTPGASAINQALDAIDAALAPTGPISRPAARRSAARCTTARSSPFPCAMPATSTAMGWRWSA